MDFVGNKCNTYKNPILERERKRKYKKHKKKKKKKKSILANL